MIEVVYNGETKQPNAPADTSQGTLKNIRQIGNISGNTKIYVENCTMGFLEKQIRKQEPPVIALLGKEVKEEESVSLFVNGAVVAEKIAVKGNKLDFAADAFTELYDETAAYFPKNVILGWFLPAYEMIGAYADMLGDYSRLFLLEEPTEQEELFYIREEKRLFRQGGYYIYYQNNEQMKQYMRQYKEAEEELQKQQKQAQAEEEPQLRAEGWADMRKKAFAGGEAEGKKIWTASVRRNTEKEKFDSQNAEKKKFADDYKEETEGFSAEQPRLTAFLYGVSTVLAIVVLVIGITMISNYERMYEMQETIETIAGSIVENHEGKTEETEEGEKAIDVSETEETQNADEQDHAGENADGQSDTQNDTAPDSGQSSEAGGAAGEQNAPQSAQADETEVTAGNAVVYTVQEGDTLTSISRKFYLSEDYVDKILEANEDIKQNELTVGQKIILP